jgi:hypothetical protein
MVMVLAILAVMSVVLSLAMQNCSPRLLGKSASMSVVSSLVVQM